MRKEYPISDMQCRISNIQQPREQPSRKTGNTGKPRYVWGVAGGAGFRKQPGTELRKARKTRNKQPGGGVANEANGTNGRRGREYPGIRWTAWRCPVRIALAMAEDGEVYPAQDSRGWSPPVELSAPWRNDDSCRPQDAAAGAMVKSPASSGGAFGWSRPL